MIRDRKWAKLLGDLGHEATLQLLSRLASKDPVWKASLVEHLKELMAELLGEDPSVLEKLLVRRVVSGWIAVHMLEVEYASVSPDRPIKLESLDKAISRAQRRYTEAIHELASVRRLQAPKILSQIARVEGSRESHGPPGPEVIHAFTEDGEPELTVTRIPLHYPE